ncbi:MAG: protein-L-isoaspartate O-methyltransferase [Kordiimonas sp.]|nr:protein-L-isoaspartate O-methyltransferase [Kordiimonas sp.]
MVETKTKSHLFTELQKQGIRDEKVLEAMDAIPREKFILPAFKDKAYANAALPIEKGQTISQPYIVAFMTEQLKITQKMKVLEIGTGSGYQAAILSKLCRRVFTVERHLQLLKAAEERFKKLHLYNITTLFGDGMRGWAEQAPFERIMVTAAAESIPEKLVDQLEHNGVMILPVGRQTGVQPLVRITRTNNHFEEEELIPTRFVPLLPGIDHNGD